MNSYKVTIITIMGIALSFSLLFSQELLIENISVNCETELQQVYIEASNG